MIQPVIPMPRVRNPGVDKMSFEALVARVEALEKALADKQEPEEKAASTRGRPRKE